MDEIDNTDIKLIQQLWHEVFGGDLIPSEDGATILLSEAIDLRTAMDAIYICNDKDGINSFEARFAYIRGILRNKRSSKLFKKWGK